MVHKMVLSAAALVALASSSFAGGNCYNGACGVSAGYGASAGCGTYTQYVPEWTTELRTVKTTEYRHEERERTYTVYSKVPVKQVVNFEYTVMVPEGRVKIENYTICKPVL